MEQGGTSRFCQEDSLTKTQGIILSQQLARALGAAVSNILAHYQDVSEYKLLQSRWKSLLCPEPWFWEEVICEKRSGVQPLKDQKEQVPRLTKECQE